jgi:hypothetical protein
MGNYLSAAIFAIILLGGCVSEEPPSGSDNLRRCMSQCMPEDQGSGLNCEEGCKIQEAQDSKDVSWCDSLGQNKPVCYGTVAKAAGDISICKKLQDPTEKKHCIATFGGQSTG